MGQYWTHDDDPSLQEVMDLLEDNPDHAYIFETKTTAMVCRPRTGDFLLLLGDFTGDPIKEIVRLLKLM